MEKRRTLLLTFGHNLDHSNIHALVQDRLAKNKGGLQKDYFDPVLHKGAEVILNYRTIDTNFNRISDKYYLDDYHLTESQINGFQYSLQRLKGCHVFCEPRIRGHAYAVVKGIEFSFYVHRSLDGIDYLFPQYWEDANADQIVRRQLPKLPEHEQFLEMPAAISDAEKDEIKMSWILKLVEF
ncbi:hypothetical protein HII30_04365 [Paenibacillus lemnae]|uniref:Uncharacterized protein n=2 Tax=Paenibacillus lemnae TaxID=1330551 RepID=A0A848M473_PAELE|nr:hypothetical protein [Paenibacillus lemnae]